MRQLSYGFVCIFLLFHSSALTAAGLSNLDQGNLISAIDDYRFSDYDMAINKLENLYQKAPDNADILQYLALSYDENNKSNKAIPLFQAWLKNHNKTTNKGSRFAWLGLTNAYMKTNQMEKATNTLQTWVNANPDDVQSQVTLGDMLIRQKKYAESKPLWENILVSNSANSSDKAAAWYYKSWLTYLDGDAQNTKKYAQHSLQADPESAYASAAKKLEANPSQQRLGFNGYASVEAFYNSNVIIAPENSNTYSRDLGIQTNVILGWALPKVNLNYLFSNTAHQDFKAYDLMIHVFSASWKKDNIWRFKPVYEFIALDSSNLYQSFGLGAYYTNNDWVFQYTAKIKNYNNAYGTNQVNLDRLSGSNHYFGAKTKVALNNIDITLSPYLIAELTKGDATHNSTDSYYQLGGTAATTIPIIDQWKTQLKLNLYARFYTAADTNILLNASDATKRQDIYFKIASSTSWKPWDNYDISLVANASYLKNISNYDDSLVSATASKAYSAWRLGGMITGQW